ncbi:MAG: NAD(P)H-binding protein [Chloroflexi bacterium]|nr:NAD(P)H-binding protein [Chloroflexota bacterium]
MKIVVFGASHGVGLEVVKQALKAGHAVTAFVRSPEKFTVKDANLTVFKGDSMDTEAVEKAIAGQDAVISALGPTRPPVPHMMETSAKNIVAGMK